MEYLIFIFLDALNILILSQKEKKEKSLLGNYFKFSHFNIKT